MSNVKVTCYICVNVYNKKMKDKLFKSICCMTVTVFIFNTVCPTPLQAQVIAQPSPPVIPSSMLIKGLQIFPQEPLRFDFIMDQGFPSTPQEDIRKNSQVLIKYFMTALTIPESDVWVNLSPFEKERIIPANFEKTQMGLDLLEEDLKLKQLTAEFLSPEHPVGRAFWDHVYEEIFQKYGITDIPIETLSKVWIVPAKAVLYENGMRVFVVESQLKVLTDRDYFGMKFLPRKNISEIDENINQDVSRILKDIVIPEIEKEINEGKRFGRLRQIYHSFILAEWYKRRLKDSIFKRVYNDKAKTNGLESSGDGSKEAVYQQYLNAYHQGAQGLVHEEYDPARQDLVVKKYVTGGFLGKHINAAMIVSDDASLVGKIYFSQNPLIVFSRFVNSPTPLPEFSRIDKAQLSDDSNVLAVYEDRSGQYAKNSLLMLKVNFDFLPRDHQVVQWVESRVRRLLPGVEEKYWPKIRVLGSMGYGPNAFVTPEGMIVVTPELLQMIEYNEELDHVLLHEINHWYRNHHHQLPPTMKGVLGLWRYFEYESDIVAFYQAGEPQRQTNPYGAIVFQERMRDMVKKEEWVDAWDVEHGRADFTDRILNLKTTMHLVNLMTLSENLTDIPVEIKQSLGTLKKGHDLLQLFAMSPLDNYYRWAERAKALVNASNEDLLLLTIGEAYQKLVVLNGTKNLSTDDGVLVHAYKDLFQAAIQKWVSVFNESTKTMTESDRTIEALIRLEISLGLPIFTSEKLDGFLNQDSFKGYRMAFWRLMDNKKGIDKIFENLAKFKKYNDSVWLSPYFVFSFAASLVSSMTENQGLFIEFDEALGQDVTRLSEYYDFLKTTVGRVESLYQDELREESLTNYRNNAISEGIFYGIKLWFENEGPSGHPFKTEFYTKVLGDKSINKNVIERRFRVFKYDNKSNAGKQSVIESLRQEFYERHNNVFTFSITEEEDRQRLKTLVEKLLQSIREAQVNVESFKEQLMEIFGIFRERPELIDVFKRAFYSGYRIDLHFDFDPVSIKVLKLFLGFLVMIARDDDDLRSYMNSCTSGLSETIVELSYRNVDLESFERADDFFHDFQALKETFGSDPIYLKANPIRLREYDVFEYVALIGLRDKLKDIDKFEEFFLILKNFLSRWTVPNFKSKFYRESFYANFIREMEVNIVSQGLQKLAFDGVAPTSDQIQNFWSLSFFLPDLSLRKIIQEFLVRQLSSGMTYRQSFQFLLEDYAIHGFLGDYHALTDLIERAETPEELDEMRALFLKKIQSKSFLEGGSLAVVVELLLLRGNLKDKKRKVFEALLKSKFDDRPLAGMASEIWWGAFQADILRELLEPEVLAGRTKSSLEEYSKYLREEVQYIQQTGNTALSLPSVSMTMIEQMFYSMNDFQKSFLTRQLLAGKDGIMYDRQETRKFIDRLLNDYMDSSHDLKTAEVLKDVVDAYIKRSSMDDLYLMLESFFSRRIGLRPDRFSSREDVVSEGIPQSFWNDYYDEVDYGFGHLGSKSDPKWTNIKDNAVQIINVMALTDVKIKADQPNMLDWVVQRIESERSTEEILQPIDFVLQTMQKLGTPGVRSLQLLGYLIDLPEAIRDKFMTVFDAIEGQTKIAFHEHLKQEDPDYAKRIVKIGEKLGGGSFFTVYEVFVRATENDYPGEESVIKREAVRMMNPNTAWRAKNDLKLVRQVLQDLSLKGKKYKRILFLADLLEEWIDSELNDPTFHQDDQLFRKKWDGKSLGGQWENWTIKVPRVINPKSMRLIREELIGGDTLTHMQEWAESDRKDTIAFGFQHYLAQLLGGTTSEEMFAANEVIVHSDVSPGNYKNTFQKEFAVLDRNMYLKFNRQDRMTLMSLQTADDLKEKVEIFLNWIKETDRNKDGILSTEFQKTANEIYESLKAHEGEDFSDVIFYLFNEIFGRDIYIPLKIILLFRNMNVWKKLGSEAGFGSLEEMAVYKRDNAMLNDAPNDLLERMQLSREKGGIDFNMTQANLLTGGRPIEMEIPDLSAFAGENFVGFEPVILSVHVTTIEELLADESQDAPDELATDVGDLI